MTFELTKTDGTGRPTGTKLIISMHRIEAIEVLSEKVATIYFGTQEFPVLNDASFQRLLRTMRGAI